MLNRFKTTEGQGYSPEGSLLFGKDDVLYGSTYFRVTSSNCGASGCGTVFAFEP